ncbi:2,4-dienoyl-CoA reductase-like NADH-dependent reductase (Old Yellow Enzyme family)/thioredoxin reductase [Clostridium pascui]|uniref:NAD(P)/FAD-dependent oxidoreductase n=1 Tax=Clostridium pascui TaxID=46609 RepID=UPI0019578700|nr:NAD(P)/FAD-dependent oxidoreductase [Clostridium pascui]MBM7869868.1 2,4-dienoyl-CoA reductase-like NADH-dependent reductase (Old Yellow Enzyme family)/thioredoxin reductase [Clostridium pascui]
MSKLFTPIKIGNLELKNRFMLAPMENGLADLGGEVNQRIIDFFVERAKNEVAIIISGSVGISPEGRGLPTQLSIYDDKFIPGLKRMTDAVHEAGAKIGAQIYHAGRQASEAVTGIQPIAPSAIPCAILGNNPREMTKEDIIEIKEKFKKAAERSIEAGFDLIEVHFAHGYLLHSFLSPHSNKRDDEYGGSLENRMRFPMEVLKEIVEVSKGEVPVIIRISADEYLEDGLKFEEVKTICKKAVNAGIDAISLTAGSYDAVEYTIQPMFINQGFLIPFGEQLKKEVNVPVIVAGRLNSAELIESIVEEDKADMVAIGRGLIADEELVVKMKNKDYEDIRYCVACNQGCIDKVFLGQGINCLVNARAGYDRERKIEKASKVKNVVIIGAGPAGLEAARVSRLRGHNVTIVNKQNKVGGKMETLSTPPEKDTFLFFRDYLYNQYVRLGIKFVQQDVKSHEDIKELNPDAVIIATGASQTVPPIKGIESKSVLLAEDVLNGDVKVGSTVAIIGGGLVGTETAKYLAAQGIKVHIIEMMDAIAKDIGATFVGHLFEVLNKHGVEQHVNAKVKEITESGVILEDGEIKADNVIIAAGYKPNDEIAGDIKNNFKEIYTIGDAKKARRIMDAVEEGFTAACEI